MEKNDNKKNNKGKVIFSNKKEEKLDINPPSIVGDKIKKARLLAGKTQMALGVAYNQIERDKTGNNNRTDQNAYVTIAQYESGYRKPKRDKLEMIAEALGIEEAVFFHDELDELKQMYQALFDIQDYHGLHPVDIDGRIVLEFGGRTINKNKTQKNSYDSFLRSWLKEYNKTEITPEDTETEIKKKTDEYTSWKMHYPKNEIRARERRMVEKIKKNK